MGQAFDRDGNVLGEAEGASKKEVFDKLIKEIPHAHELRIKEMRDNIGSVGGAPKVDRMLQFFQYAHLPPHLQVASKPFCDLATIVTDTFPSNPERTVALRKLLEAKDAAVRAILYKD